MRMNALSRTFDFDFVFRGGNPQQFLAVQISERCPDFHFISNLNRSYRNTCSHFHLFSKLKSGRPDFWKGVHIFVFDENQNVNTFPVQICTEKVFTFRFSSKTQMWTPFQKSGRPDLWFEEIENVNTFPKIWTARFAFLMKMKIRTPFKNLNGQKLLRISTSGV